MQEKPTTQNVNPPVTNPEVIVPATTEIPTVPTVTVEANKETSDIGGQSPVPVEPTVPVPVTPSTTDYKWDATTNSYKEVPNANATVPAPTPVVTPTPAPTPTHTQAEAVDLPGTDKTQAEFDVFKGRENEVLANLNSAYSSGIKDSDGIKKFASYNTATPEKKAAIDAFIANKANEELSAKEGSQFGSEEGIFGAISNNVMVPASVMGTEMYKSALKRSKALNFLLNYSANDIAAVIKNGKLVPGSKNYADLYNTAKGKALIEKANKLNSISGNSLDVTKAGENLTTKVLSDNANVAKALADNQISAEELNAMTSTPELEATQKALAAKKLEIQKLQSDRDRIRDDVDKKYSGFVTGSERAQIIANRTRDINRTLDPLLLEYNSEFGQYATEKEKLVNLFNTNLGLYKEEKANKDKLALVADERKYQEAIMDKKNTYDSINAQIKFAQENGVDLQRTDANVIIADATKYANENGVSLQEAIKETFTKPLTEKDSYKRALQAIYDKNSGKMTDFQKAQLAQGKREFDATMGLNYDKLGFDMEKFKLEQNKPDWVQDKETWEWVNRNSSYKPWVTVDEKGQPFSVANYSTSRNGSTSVTCGQLTNDYIADVTWGTFTKRMGDSIESKEAVIKELGESPVPVVGGLFTFRTNTPYGHTWIVSAVNPDGSITVREANRSQSHTGKTPAETHKYSADFVKENMKFSVAPSTAKFYKDEYVWDIIKMMGWETKLTDKDIERIEGRAKGYMGEGLSPRQAGMRMAGLKIKDPNNEDLALDLFEKSTNFSDKDARANFGPAISTFINSGDTEGALNYFEKQVDADVKKTYDKEAILSSQRMETKKWNNEIVSLVNSNRKDIGLIDGTLAEWKKKIEANPKLQRLNTILTKIQADERKYFAGSAVTSTELNALRDFIGGTTKMNPDNLIAQIKTLEELNDSEFRSQRAPYGY